MSILPGRENLPNTFLMLGGLVLPFAAVRLAVLDELDSDEDLIFDQRSRERRRLSGWRLDAEEESGSETAQHAHPYPDSHPGAGRRRSKALGCAQGDVAFSSPLVSETITLELGGKKISFQCSV